MKIIINTKIIKKYKNIDKCLLRDKYSIYGTFTVR